MRVHVCVWVALALPSVAFAQGDDDCAEGTTEIDDPNNALAGADRETLAQILSRAGVNEAAISSSVRTPDKQAELMLQKIELESVAAAKRLYCDAGDRVIDAYSPGRSHAENFRAMRDELLRQMPAARKLGCLNHIENPDVYAIDIGKDQVTSEALRQALIASGEQAVRDGWLSRFFYPPTDKDAFHFEFRKRAGPGARSGDNLPSARCRARKACRQIEAQARIDADRLMQQGDDLYDQASQAIQQRANDDTQAYNQLQSVLQSVDKLNDDTSQKLGDLSQQLDDMVAAAKKTLEEMRQGYFCSRCMRSASEIEAAEHVSFEDHLGEVDGVPVPATQEQLDAKAAELDAAIKQKYDNYVNTYNNYVDQFNQYSQQYSQADQARVNTWNQDTRTIFELQQKSDDAYDRASRLYQQKQQETLSCLASNP